MRFSRTRLTRRGGPDHAIPRLSRVHHDVACKCRGVAHATASRRPARSRAPSRTSPAQPSQYGQDEDAEMPLRKIHHPVGAYTAEEKKEFAEMNLTDHAGVRLTHGKPKVNGVEIHYAIGGAGEPVFLLHGVPKTMSYWRHV